jgi:hypothetical protein
MDDSKRFATSAADFVFYQEENEMNAKPKPYDVVALLQDVPEEKISRGMVGTVVEPLDDEHVLVEFSNSYGETLAIVPLQINLLLVLEWETASGVSGAQ